MQREGDITNIVSYVTSVENHFLMDLSRSRKDKITAESAQPLAPRIRHLYDTCSLYYLTVLYFCVDISENSEIRRKSVVVSFFVLLQLNFGLEYNGR